MYSLLTKSTSRCLRISVALLETCKVATKKCSQWSDLAVVIRQKVANMRFLAIGHTLNTWPARLSASDYTIKVGASLRLQGARSKTRWELYEARQILVKTLCLRDHDRTNTSMTILDHAPMANKSVAPPYKAKIALSLAWTTKRHRKVLA